MSTNNVKQWVTFPKPQPHAQLRLFCLPFAGGGASIYRSWVNQLSPNIEVCPIQLPARENRYSESAITDAKLMANLVMKELLPFINKPYAIFGHSMGALLAFEVCRSLQAGGHVLPKVVFLSAHRAPHLPRKRDLLYLLPENQFIDRLKAYGGFPDEILNNQEFLNFILPIMRSDMTLCDLYQYEEKELSLNIHFELFVGEQDPEVGFNEMSPWAIHTNQSSSLTTFKGGHFFLRSHESEVIESIKNKIELSVFS